MSQEFQLDETPNEQNEDLAAKKSKSKGLVTKSRSKNLAAKSKSKTLVTKSKSKILASGSESKNLAAKSASKNLAARSVSRDLAAKSVSKDPAATSNEVIATESKESIKSELENIEELERPEETKEPEDQPELETVVVPEAYIVDETVSIAPSEDITDFSAYIEPEVKAEEEFELDEISMVSEKKKKRSKRKDSDDVVSLSDFIPKHAPIDGDFSALEHIESFSDISSEYIEEEEQVEEPEVVAEEEPVPVMTEEERQEYYIAYETFERKLLEEKLKNQSLMKRMVAYYQRKKMFHVLHEDKAQTDMVRRYEKQLDQYERFVDESTREMNIANAEIQEMRDKYAKKLEEAESVFEKLRSAELELGKEILGSESGRNIDIKSLERQLQRQKIQMENLRNIRLEKIKLTNKVAEVEAALAAIDNLGSHLRLMDFEQLRHDNRNLKDKLEDRELELTKVRLKCQHCVQVLAHQREKSDANNVEICKLNGELEGVNGEHEDIREHMNDLKQSKDLYRSHIEKMTESSGLLCKPLQLMDMSEGAKQIEILSKQLQWLKEECLSVTHKVKKIRSQHNNII